MAKKMKLRTVHIDDQEWQWKAGLGWVEIWSPEKKRYGVDTVEEQPITPSRIKDYIINTIIRGEKAQLSVGDLVEKQDGIRGRVLEAGPYGDQPYQILDVHGRYFSSINDDGTSATKEDVWKKVQGCEV